MEALVPTVPAVESKHARAVSNPDLKDNNAESRMNTSSKNNAITLDDSPLAHESEGKPISSNSQEVQNSQSTAAESNATSTSTPPTSDGFSSQESQLSQPVDSNGPGPASSSNTAALSAAGQKRTASGMIKPSVAKSPTSPAVGSNGGHARRASNMSSASNSSTSITERSAELRARLSYAMVKVTNGWQSLPIDEVESRISQAVSPTSSASTLQGRRNRITSPRAAIANAQTESSTDRPFSSSAPVLGASSTLASLTTDQPERTYESFWREHSANPNPPHRQSPFHPRPSLAPPVDIVSSSSSSGNALHNPRRTDPSRTSRPPPVMPIKTVSDLSQSSINSPHTPTRDPAIDTMLRTPSQKSAQEQDAIESLLFMSSPGNSTTLMHNFPPPHQPQSNQQSPLRSEFKAAADYSSSQPSSQSHQQNSHSTNRDNVNRARRVGFRAEDEESSEGGYSVSRVPSGEREQPGRSRMRGDEIDRMLDEMEDDSSDDDDIDLMSTPRRRAVGGVRP